jgi:hypothetical protein
VGSCPILWEGVKESKRVGPKTFFTLMLDIMYQVSVILWPQQYCGPAQTKHRGPGRMLQRDKPAIMYTTVAVVLTRPSRPKHESQEDNMKFQITHKTEEQFYTSVRELLVRGLGFEADVGTLTIILTGGY